MNETDIQLPRRFTTEKSRKGLIALSETTPERVFVEKHQDSHYFVTYQKRPKRSRLCAREATPLIRPYDSTKVVNPEDRTVEETLSDVRSWLRNNVPA